MTTITERKDHWLDVIFRDRVEFPGNAGILLPSGSNAERPVAPLVDNGYMRYNTDLQELEAYRQGVWTLIATGSGSAGEANDGINVGAGIGVFRDKTGVDFNFRSIRSLSPLITVTLGGGGDEVTLNTPIASLYLPLAGGSMTGDIIMLGSAQLLADPTSPATNAAIAFNTDIGTGFYQDTLGAGSIGITNSGTPSWAFTSAGDLVPAIDGGSNIGDTLTHVGVVYSDEFLARDGAPGDPSFSFTSADTTGMLLNGGGGVGFSVNGTERWYISTSGHWIPIASGYDVGTSGMPVRNFYGRYYLGNQTFSGVGSPTFSFLGDSQTGMYWPGAGTIGFSIGGDDALQIIADGTLKVPATTAASNNYEDQVVDDDHIPNKKYVDDAIVSGATQDYRLAFDSGDLVAGILTVTHGLGQDWPTVAVWDDSRKLVYPDVTSVDTNNVTVDLNAWVVVGTWNVVVIG